MTKEVAHNLPGEDIDQTYAGKFRAKDGRWLPRNPRPRCPQGQGPPRKSRAIKKTFPTRADLDLRTRAVKHFDAVARGLTEDLGGLDQLSTVQRELISAFAGIAVHVAGMNVRLLAGEKVDIGIHAGAINTLVRTAAKVGIYRLPREVQSLHDAMNQTVNAEIEPEDEDAV
jgi:hypothetical protein